MDPDAAETLWLAKWGTQYPMLIDIIAAQPPWGAIFSTLNAAGRLEQYQLPGQLKFGWKIKEKHSE